MQMFKTLKHDDAARVGWGVRVLLASPTGPDGLIARRIAGFGGVVDIESQLYDALSVVLDDPLDAHMLIIDCDAYGGLGAGRRAFALLAGPAVHLPVVLISAECREQSIPQHRGVPIILRAPVSAVALRLTFDTAFRGRRVMGAA